MKNREIIPAVLAFFLLVGLIALFYYQSAIFLPVLIALLKVGLCSLLYYYRSTPFFRGA